MKDDRTDIMDDKQLDALINGLSDEVAPERDLWPDIEARISTSGATPEAAPAHIAAHGRPYGRMLMAAAVLIAAVAGARLWWTAEPTRDAPEVALVDDAADNIADDAVPAPVTDTGWRGELQTADNTLASVLAERQETMDPELRLVIEQNLAIIDNAMADIDAALAAAPHDPALRAALIDAWRQRIALMERARALTDS